MKLASLSLFVAAVAFILFALKVIPEAPEIPYLSSALIGAIGDLDQWIFLLVAIIGLSFFVSRHRRWSDSAYVATDERVIKITRKGWLGRTFEDIPVTHIEDLKMTQTAWERYLGCGTFQFSTKGIERDGEDGESRGVQMTWKAVPGPISVRSSLQEVMDTRSKPARNKR